MSNFDSFIAFGKLVSIDRNMNPLGEYPSSAKGLSKTIEESCANGVGLLCGDGVVAVQCSRRGFESTLRFNNLIAENGGIASPYAVVDNIGRQIWHLYRSNNQKTWSYLEPFSGYINVIGKGGLVPLPGDLLGRFEWLGYAPESPEDLPPAMEWLFPSYYSSL